MGSAQVAVAGSGRPIGAPALPADRGYTPALSHFNSLGSISAPALPAREGSPSC
jgi:hypothetical protein